MPPPLYKDCFPPGCDDVANRGLWWDKFFDLWDRGGGAWKMPSGENKAEWIAQAKARACGDEKLLTETAKRIEAFVRARRGVIIEAVTAERFVTGTGLPHPVENGFLWHHNLGVPYLPGSGVKGVVLSWDRDWANDSDDNRREAVLGSGPVRGRDGAVGPGEAGAIAFLDALPVCPVKLALDGVTPHDTPYLQDATGKTPPADWHSPTPIPFLAVAEGQRFRFPIVPCSGKDAALVQDAAAWLCRALTSLGMGAKTALDHGRFKNVVPVNL